MDRLIDWLPKNIPAGDETTIVHGDYRLDNMVFHPTEPRILAVLDWELSTLGHPLADFAYHCMSWHIPPGEVPRHRGPADLAALGIPTEREYVAALLQAHRAQGHRPSIWDFYMAYNLFRIAAIRRASPSAWWTAPRRASTRARPARARGRWPNWAGRRSKRF